MAEPANTATIADTGQSRTHDGQGQHSRLLKDAEKDSERREMLLVKRAKLLRNLGHAGLTADVKRSARTDARGQMCP